MSDAPSLPRVTGVSVVADHTLRLLFDDGVVGDVAFSDHQWTGVFAPLRDPANFARVAIEYGTVVWPDFGVDMAPEPLHEAAVRNALVQPASSGQL